jgi:hypothetical protein
MSNAVIEVDHLSQNKEGDEDKLTPERARLESHAFRLIARRREVNLELGRTFVQIKATLKHGQWKSYFKETFGSSISLRTAERYMEKARAGESGAGSKSDNLSLFKPATDHQSTKIRQATVKARAEVGDSKNHTLKLPLSVTPRESEDILALWSSPHRIEAEREIIAHLKRLCEKSESLRLNEHAKHTA